MAAMRRTERVMARAVTPIETLEPRRLLSAATADAEAPAASLAAVAGAPRVMENLGRGVVAVRATSTSAFISWRLLGLDPAGIGFNVYRSATGGAPVKLNATPLTGGTNYTDSTANLT